MYKIFLIWLLIIDVFNVMDKNMVRDNIDKGSCNDKGRNEWC